MDYSIHTDVRYGPLELVEAGRLADECTQRWWNQTLCRVNDCVARIGVFEGEFHWHKHDREDEFFYVIEGRLLLDLEDRTVELAPRQGLMVPRGVPHRTRAPQRTVVLMVEAASIVPTGD
jgi:mannose-6-phosphate isomerase-like protein (cupin superfamily)